MFDYKQSLLLKVVSLYVIIFLRCSVSQETREETIVLWKPKVTFEDFDAVKARYSNSFCEHDDKNYFKIRVKLPLADARSHKNNKGHAQHIAFVLQFGRLCMLNRLRLGENLP